MEFPPDEQDDPAILETERRVWLHDAQVSHSLAGKIDAKFLADPNPVGQCLSHVQRRVLAATQTLLVLHDAEHDYSFDAAVVLRGLYDAHLQGLYVLLEPETRSRDFLDFLCVQTKDTVDWIEKSDTVMAEMLRSNPLYTVATPGVDAHYARVRPKFLTKKGDQVRANWYKGNLADLARAVGYFTEYEFMQPKLSGSVHSTPYAMIHGAGLPKSGFLNFAWMFVFRIQGGIAEYLKLELDEYERQCIKLARISIPDFTGQLPE